MRKFNPPVFHDDGRIEYEPTADKPPDINGYERDRDNAWLFHPLWDDCKARLRGVQNRPCGSVQLLMLCNNPEASKHKKPVYWTDCEDCPVRKIKAPAN